MSMINIFDILALLAKKGIIEEKETNTTYCDCCGKNHVRVWFQIKKREDKFYICIPTDTAMINYASGNWGQISPLDLLNQLI